MFLVVIEMFSTKIGIFIEEELVLEEGEGKYQVNFL